MTASAASWGFAMAPGIRKWIDDAYKAYTPYYPKLLNVDSSSRQYEDDVDSTGIGKLEEVAAGGSTIFEDAVQGYKTRYTHRLFRKGMSVQRSAADDDLQRVLRKDASKLGKSAARTKDYYAMGDMFRGAFDTAKTSYGDNLPLCSTVHTRPDGGSTQSNASSTGIILSEPNLNTALLAAREVVDGKGEMVNFMDAKPILMIAPYQEKLAMELVGSNLKSATSDNDLNFYKEFAQFDVLVNPWLSANSTNSTKGSGTDLYWFIIFKGEHQLNYITRQELRLESEVDFDTKALKTTAEIRFSYGWSDWRGLWGSRGDAAAYSS